MKIDPDGLPTQEAFPLEPVCIFVGKEKIASDTGPSIRFFWCHRKMAKALLFQKKLCMPDQFEQVHWSMVHETLHEVLHMLQVWACKQVMSIASTNFNQSQYQQDKDPKCRSCGANNIS